MVWLTKSKFLSLSLSLILCLALILIYTPVSSNQAQVSIFNAGMNLGSAKARFQIFGQDTMERFTLRDLGWAREAIVMGESQMAQFTSICENRRNLIARIITMIDDYSRSTQNSNANARRTYINNIFERYRSAVAITLGTARLDTCRSQPNCDGQLALAGYKFGQVLLSSGVQGNQARSFQLVRIGETRDAIRKGIWMSMDVPNQEERMTGINKLCCCFGDTDEWHRFMNSLSKNTPLQTLRDLMNGIRGTIRRANLDGTPCQSGESRREDNRREDHRRDDNRQEENLVRGSIITRCKLGTNGTNGFSKSVYLYTNGRTEVYGTFNGKFGGEKGGWSLDSSNVFSLWGSKLGRFSGPVYKFKDNGFKVIGTWANGTRETITFLCHHIITD